MNRTRLPRRALQLNFKEKKPMGQCRIKWLNQVLMTSWKEERADNNKGKTVGIQTILDNFFTEMHKTEVMQNEDILDKIACDKYYYRSILLKLTYTEFGLTIWNTSEKPLTDILFLWNYTTGITWCNWSCMQTPLLL